MEDQFERDPHPGSEQLIAILKRIGAKRIKENPPQGKAKEGHERLSSLMTLLRSNCDCNYLKINGALPAALPIW